MGCCSRTVLSRSPCSQNSAATDKATWNTTGRYVQVHTHIHTLSYPRWNQQRISRIMEMLFPLTLLCTSQGLVMAERSQAVIIMALKTKQTTAESQTGVRLFRLLRGGCTHMTISFLVVSRDMKSTHFFSSSYVCERSTIFWNMVLFLQEFIYLFIFNFLLNVKQCL